MSSHTWVCFTCRLTIRRDPYANPPPICQHCGQECSYIGHKIRLPPKNKPEEWERLRLSLNQQKQETSQREFQNLVWRKHSLEKEIAKLEALPANNGRKKLISQLEKDLKFVQENLNEF